MENTDCKLKSKEEIAKIDEEKVDKLYVKA